MVHEAAADTSKKLHPFFVKGAATEAPTPAANTAPATSRDDDSASDAGDGDNDGSMKRRKTDPSLPQDAPEPKKQRKGKNGGVSLDGSILNHLNKPADASHPNDDPTNTPTNDFPTPPLSDTSVKMPDAPPPAPVHVEAGPATPGVPPQAKKVLKFNPKTGTLGSPPKPKSKAPLSRIVAMKYGRDADHRKEIGDKITQILEGKWQVPATPTKRRRLRAPKNVKYTIPEAEPTSKVTHPFFSGKTKPQSEPAKAVEPPKKKKRDSVFMSTPVSPRKSRAPFNPNSSHKLPQFGMKSTGTKIPGAMLPLWPAQGMSHVRGDDMATRTVQTTLNDGPLPRKFKGQRVRVPQDESTLSRLADRLDLCHVRNTLPRSHDAFEPAPSELRLPRRHFESGRKLQKRIRSQLRTCLVHAQSLGVESSQDELSEERPARVHPALSRLYDSLETQLSAYDRSTCESQAWTHKYAPVGSSEVLQAGKEGSLLRQWLEALKVQSVDTGDGSAKSKAKADGAVKKKRKKNKLDGFVVDSSDEANEMDEVSEDEADWAAAGPGRLNKTVVRGGKGKEHGRLANVAVLSGPHGCGKTAAVYAVAKELGFEVFEINSSTRRSGRDILEKVGDMTRNHLVQQHRAEGPSEPSANGEVENDIKSGKQGMMTAFFKPKAERGQGPPKQPKGSPEEEVKSSTPKAQKQSLILLEEVDILYEEDKHFWATLMTLIVQSKRPFIMTCNDERLVPLQSLNLHGIFRFSPPPTDLAVDLCLLIAANEGHALQRSAIEALYNSRGDDLRATITDLNYWCQLGVGDRRGGFDWFYLRWPRGSDLDENGDVVRVVSENTHVKGMDWLGRDLIATAPDRLEMEEEAMRQSWDLWQLDMGDWADTMDLESWAETQVARGPKVMLPTLEAYDEFCGSMSDADLCSSGGFGSGLFEAIDPTLPDLPSKTRDDFILGRALLEASPMTRPNCPSVDISISLRSLARSDLHRATNTTETPSSVLDAVDEDKAISILDSSFHSSPHQLNRYDLSLAFDPIAVSDKPPSGTLLDPSVLDRTLTLIVLDVAPWVRGIVQFDHRLMHERLKLSNLLSEGGKRKRMRTTRSAYSALEGGERRTTRRERYFGDKLVTGLVMRTAGEAWQDAIGDVEGIEEATTVEVTTAEGSPRSGDEMLVSSP